MSESARFRGALVVSPWTRGSFWDRVDLTSERICLRPCLRKTIVLDRSEVRAVEFEEVRSLLTMTWATNVRFQLVNGTHAPKLFIPARPRRLRRTLESLGWMTQDRV